MFKYVLYILLLSIALSGCVRTFEYGYVLPQAEEANKYPISGKQLAVEFQSEITMDAIRLEYDQIDKETKLFLLAKKNLTHDITAQTALLSVVGLGYDLNEDEYMFKVGLEMQTNFNSLWSGSARYTYEDAFERHNSTTTLRFDVQRYIGYGFSLGGRIDQYDNSTGENIIDTPIIFINYKEYLY